MNKDIKTAIGIFTIGAFIPLFVWGWFKGSFWLLEQVRIHEIPGVLVASFVVGLIFLMLLYPIYDRNK